MITCFSYTKFNVNVISLVFSIAIIFLISIILRPFNKFTLNAGVQGYYNSSNDEINISNKEIENTKEVIDSNVWQLEIPKINLKANIAEGTTNEVLNNFIGHFTETPKSNGNIGLAAHNRGYQVNYFEKIKELELGDEIFYTYEEIKKKYVITLKSIIKDTDWNNLQNTEDNKITLITCVENMPEYRRCIQGIEVTN